VQYRVALVMPRFTTKSRVKRLTRSLQVMCFNFPLGNDAVIAIRVSRVESLLRHAN
jgi:hypothetical protein